MKSTGKKMVMLDDDELEQVSGGTVNELIEDSQVLYNYNMLMRPVSTGTYRSNINSIAFAWDSIGIEFTFDEANNNKYFDHIMGEEISHEQALALVKERSRGAELFIPE